MELAGSRRCPRLQDRYEDVPSLRNLERFVRDSDPMRGYSTSGRGRLASRTRYPRWSSTYVRPKQLEERLFDLHCLHESTPERSRSPQPGDGHSLERVQFWSQ